MNLTTKQKEVVDAFKKGKSAEYENLRTSKGVLYNKGWAVAILVKKRPYSLVFCTSELFSNPVKRLFNCVEDIPFIADSAGVLLGIHRLRTIWSYRRLDRTGKKEYLCKVWNERVLAFKYLFDSLPLTVSACNCINDIIRKTIFPGTLDTDLLKIIVLKAKTLQNT